MRLLLHWWLLRGLVKLHLQALATFFGEIVKTAGENSQRAFSLLPSVLPALLEAGRKAGLSPDQIATLFGEIVEGTGAHEWSAVRALPTVLEAGLSPAQITTLFGQVIEGTGKDAGKAFGALPASLEAARKADLRFFLQRDQRRLRFDPGSVLPCGQPPALRGGE